MKKSNKQILREFKEATGYDLKNQDGRYEYSGSLYLRGTAISSLPDNLTVGGSLYLRGTAISSLPDNLTVGGYLDLQGTAISSLPDNLTVGGSLYLLGTAISSLPDNLTVGGSLYLRGTAISSLPDNLTVGGSLYLRGTAISSLPDIKKSNNTPILPEINLSWQKERYIKKDDVFTEVIAHQGNVWQVRHIGKHEIEYLITDGKGNYAHGETLEEAKEDLIYKVTDRKKSDYERLTLQDTLSHEEAIRCYRVITGACSTGIKYFINNLLNGNRKEQYTIEQIIRLTKGQYGNEVFAEFFTK